jgi:hypothetical protein
MILHQNKILLPPMSTWTRGLNKIPLTPVPMPAVPELLKMPVQVRRAPA